MSTPEWPFAPKPLRPASFFQRLVRRKPKENAAIAVNNVLASFRNANDVSGRAISEALVSFKIRPAELEVRLQPVLIEFLAYVIDGGDQTAVEPFRTLFPVGKDVFAAALKAAGNEVYARGIDARIEDGRLSKQDRVELEELRERLSITEEVATQIYGERAKVRIGRFVEFITADQRISPGEDRRLSEMSQSLGFTLQVDDNSDRIFARYRALWKLEHGELPEVSVTVALKPREVCHFTSPCVWYEYRVTRTVTSYSGFRYHSRIGSYYSGTRITEHPIRRESLVPIEAGSFFVTGSRVLFVGTNKSVSVPIGSIVDCTTFTNGITLIRDRGKNPFIEFKDNVDVCSMVLGQLMTSR
jgi:hypothetical protein